jgi:hypothetical protein
MREARTAKLTPFEMRTTELTLLVPLPQGKTQLGEASGAKHDDPGPLLASKPADVARDWNNVME